MSSQRWMLLVLTCFLVASGVSGQELPPRAVVQLGDRRFHHGCSIELAALSPDGRNVASVARKRTEYILAKEIDDPADRTIVIWDAATGKRTRELLVPIERIGSIVFSPDSTRLIAACGSLFHYHTLVVFDVDSGKLVEQRKFQGDLGRPRFSSDGKRLLACEGHRVVVALDVSSLKEVARWEAPAAGSEWITSAEEWVSGELSPGGKHVAWFVAKTPDDGRLRYNPHIVVIAEADTKKVLYRKSFKYFPADSFVFSPDGRWFVVGSDAAAWETATGKELFRLPRASYWPIPVSPDGRWALVIDSRRGQLYDLKAQKPTYEILNDRAYHRIDPQSFSADGKTFLARTESTLRLFDVATGKERMPPGHRTPTIMVRFSADGRTLQSTCDELRCAWDFLPGKKPALVECVARKTWESGGRTDRLPSNDGKYFIHRVDSDCLTVGDSATGKVLHRLKQDAWKGWFSPDGTRLALHCEYKFLALYDTKTATLSGKIDLVDVMGWMLPIFSPDGRTIAHFDCANDVHLHDAITGKAIRTLRSERSFADRLVDGYLLYTPDGSRLIVVTYDVVADQRKTLPTRVFDVASGRELRRFFSDPPAGRDGKSWSCAACSPDNRLLAVVDRLQNVVRLVEIDSGQVRAEFRGHEVGVHDLAFSPDGRWLASGGEDNVIYVWDAIGTAGLPGLDATPTDLERWWTELGQADAKRAEAVIVALIRAGGMSVKVLDARLKPAERFEPKRLKTLLDQLDAASFADREAATVELMRVSDRIREVLEVEMSKEVPLEARQRIERILAKSDGRTATPAMLQTLRAIETLERIGTPEAAACLNRLAAGASEAWETRAAMLAAERLRKF